MSHYNNNKYHNKNYNKNYKNNYHNKSNTVEVHCKYVPQRVQKKQWLQFVNKSTNNKKWRKNYKSNKEWVIVVNSNEANEWKTALNGKSIQNTKITVYIKGGNKRQSAFNNQNKNFRSGNKGNNKYTKTFTKHLSNKQQSDMLNLLSKRYNGDNKMLNLSAIVSPEQEHWASFSNQSFVTHLFTIIKNNCSEVKSIDFSNNNIVTLENFKKCIANAQYLENLSLLDNPIRNFSEINYLNNAGVNIRELYLQNLNLLNEVSKVKQLYVYEISKRFPNLRLLDGENISNVSLLSFGPTIDGLNANLFTHTSAMPVSVHNLCNDQSHISDFIANYYKSFDSDRRKIISLYHCDAIFTLTYCNALDIPFGITAQENKSNNFKDVNQSCNRVNRNLIDGYYLCQPRFKQLQKVRHGNIDIIKYLSEEFVQRTKHQMSYMSIDCHPIKVGMKQFMQVLINGYFAENQSVARKFNRTWLLTQENTGIIIVNDQLHLGGVIPQTKLLKHAPASSIADLNKQKTKGNIVNNSGNGFGDVSVGNGNVNNQDLISKVANRCGCPIQISKQALEASNWDPQVAVTKIETLKAQRSQQQ